MENSIPEIVRTLDIVSPNYRFLVIVTRGTWIELFVVIDKWHWPKSYLKVTIPDTYPAAHFSLV